MNTKFFQIKELDLPVKNKKGTLEVKNPQGINYFLHNHSSVEKKIPKL